MKAGAELFNPLDRHPGHQLGHLGSTLVSTFRISGWSTSPCKGKMAKTLGFLRCLTMFLGAGSWPKMTQNGPM